MNKIDIYNIRTYKIVNICKQKLYIYFKFLNINPHRFQHYAYSSSIFIQYIIPKPLPTESHNNAKNFPFRV